MDSFQVLNWKLKVSTIIIVGICMSYPCILITAMTSSFLRPGVFSVAYITSPTLEVAKKIAKGLVENQLAACVNIVPNIISIYKWEGKMEEDSELLLIVKTRTDKVGELTSFVKANHPYDVPEVISTPIEGGHDLYLKFLDENMPEKKHT